MAAGEGEGMFREIEREFSGTKWEIDDDRMNLASRELGRDWREIDVSG